MEGQLLHLDPSKVLAEDNSRFGLKKARIKALADDILDKGGILEPVEVEALSPPKNGYTHRLIFGFYRHAAATLLNKEQNAGVALPAQLYAPADDLDRLKRQLSENMNRESQSPMDAAIAIKQLLDAGVSRESVRGLFARPGGRKGAAIQPVSNSFLNMHLAFLELPKAIQTKIHEGLIGVQAAYEITRVPADKREALVERIEKNRLADIEREERDEQREAERAAKDAAKAEKLAAAQQALADAQQAEKDATTLRAEKDARLRELNRTPGFLELPKEEQKAIGEQITEVKAELRDADKALSKAKQARSRAEQALKALTEPKATPVAEEEEAEPMPKATKAGKGKGKAKERPVSAADVRKASAEVGATASAALKSVADVTGMLKTVGTSRFPKVKAIADVILKGIAGTLSAGAVETDLSVITGDRKVSKA